MYSCVGNSIGIQAGDLSVLSPGGLCYLPFFGGGVILILSLCSSVAFATGRFVLGLAVLSWFFSPV